MRYLATATMAASVFAIGLSVDPAVSLPMSGGATSPQTAIQHVQQQDKGAGQEPRARGGGDRDGERGDRERGYRERGGRDRDGRRSGRGGFDLEIGPGYFGYGPRYGQGCGWLRRRALETDSPYWWRRYRACRGD